MTWIDIAGAFALFSIGIFGLCAGFVFVVMALDDYYYWKRRR